MNCLDITLLTGMRGDRFVFPFISRDLVISEISGEHQCRFFKKLSHPFLKEKEPDETAAEETDKDIKEWIDHSYNLVR